MKITNLLLSISFALLSLNLHADYSTHERYAEFVQQAGKKYGIKEAHIKKWLSQAQKQQSVLDAIARPAEGRLTWGKYRNIFLTKKRIKEGKAFLRTHKKLLNQAQKKYGVKKEIIAAIIGVETFYGTRQGGYRVLDSLTTLAFDYPKRRLFWHQLMAFFALAEEENLDLAQVKGSYAGAIGYGQFIPTSYLSYAEDGDNDGKKDLINSPADAIFSVANYFKQHGWQTGKAVAQKVKVMGKRYPKYLEQGLKPKVSLKQLNHDGVIGIKQKNLQQKATLMRLEKNKTHEYWIGLHNFYVITRYNHSQLYAMAVYQLSQALK